MKLKNLPKNKFLEALSMALLVIALTFLISNISVAQSAFIDSYPRPSIYSSSSDYQVTANGVNIDVIKFQDYDYVHFSMGPGSCRFDITVLGQTSIPSYAINPLNLNIPGSTSGNKLSFTIADDKYLIVWVSGKDRRLVIVADPHETDKPASSGTGVFNIRNSPYNADGTGTTLMTTAIQNAVNAASSYGTSTGTRGIVYVPTGIYKMGNLILKSNVSLYLEKGAILRFSDNPGDYVNHFFKNVWGTWWIYTQENSNNIKLYGRGTIDGNGYYMQKTAKYVNHLLVPLQCSNFTLDGLIMLNPACWGTVPARSNNLTFTNVKFLNSLSLGENDGIDVCESQNVLVKHSIGIGHDDPYSTKTWDTRGELPKNWYGEPESVRDVVFDDCISWTGCVGFKVGAGIRGAQENITFKNSAIYNCARGLAIDYSYGRFPVNNVTFENIYIQNIDNQCGSGPQWLELVIRNSDGDGGGPVSNVNVRNITLRERGGAPSQIRGYSSTATMTGVTLENIYVQGNTRPAATFEEMNITDINDFASNITILPRQARSSRIQAEAYVKHNQITLGEANDEGGTNFIGTNSVDYIVYDNVDFGAETSSIDVRLATMNNGGTIEFRLGASTGPLLGILNVTSTGGWETYQTRNLPVTGAKGVHTVFMITRKSDALGIANINWFELHRTPSYTTVFNDCNYLGSSVELGPGEYTQSQLLAKGIGDNTLSSMRVTPGVEAIGWENDNYQGSAFRTISNISCLTSNGFNDRVSSMKVRIASATNISGTYTLRNRYSGLYMDVSDSNANDGAGIGQWYSNSQSNQKFTFSYLGSGVYKITAVNSGKALEIENGSVLEGAKLVQNTYAGRSSQLFYVQSTEDGYYRLIAKNSNKLIEAKDLSKAPASLQQWTAGDQLSGQWQLVATTARLSNHQEEEVNVEDHSKSFQLDLYPNPSEGNLNIASSNDMSGAQITIVNSVGLIVYKLQELKSQSFDISFLKEGLYTLVITKDGKQVNKLFIKEK